MKQALIFLFILFVAEVNAQTKKNYILRTNIGYSYSYEDKMDEGDGFVPTTVSGVINNDLKFALGMGRKLNTNFYYGLGFSYEAMKQEYNPDGKIPDPNNSSGYSGIFTTYANSVSKNILYSPGIFIQYFYNISDRISINVDFYSRYDFKIATTESDLTYYQPIDSMAVIGNNYFKESKKQFISVGFSPSFRINIIKNFGMEFVFGSLEYKHKLSDSRSPENVSYSNELRLGFKPEDWLIGFYIKI